MPAIHTFTQNQFMKRTNKPRLPNVSKLFSSLSVQQPGIGELDRLGQLPHLRLDQNPYRLCRGAVWFVFSGVHRRGGTAFWIIKEQFIHRVFEYNQPAIRPADEERSFL